MFKIKFRDRKPIKKYSIMNIKEQINNLENEIAELHVGLTYPEILKVAIFTVKKIKNVLPNDTGNVCDKNVWGIIQSEIEKMYLLEEDNNFQE